MLRVTTIIYENLHDDCDTHCDKILIIKLQLPFFLWQISSYSPGGDESSSSPSQSLQ